MITYEERLEKAARVLCQLRGLNPDDVLSDAVEPGRMGGPRRNARPRWHDARAELNLHRQREEAFEAVGL